MNYKTIFIEEIKGKQRDDKGKQRDDGQYEDYKKKAAQQKREQRLAQKRKANRLPIEEQCKLQEEQRKNTRERVAKHRALKKQSSTTTASSPESPVYKSAQALERVVARAKRSLPQSPRRLHAVCQKLTGALKPSTTHHQVQIPPQSLHLIINYLMKQLEQLSSFMSEVILAARSLGEKML